MAQHTEKQKLGESVVASANNRRNDVWLRELCLQDAQFDKLVHDLSHALGKHQGQVINDFSGGNETFEVGPLLLIVQTRSISKSSREYETLLAQSPPKWLPREHGPEFDKPDHTWITRFPCVSKNPLYVSKGQAHWSCKSDQWQLTGHDLADLEHMRYMTRHFQGNDATTLQHCCVIPTGCLSAVTAQAVSTRTSADDKSETDRYAPYVPPPFDTEDDAAAAAVVQSTKKRKPDETTEPTVKKAKPPDTNSSSSSSSSSATDRLNAFMFDGHPKSQWVKTGAKIDLQALDAAKERDLVETAKKTKTKVADQEQAAVKPKSKKSEPEEEEEDENGTQPIQTKATGEKPVKQSEPEPEDANDTPSPPVKAKPKPAVVKTAKEPEREADDATDAPATTVVKTKPKAVVGKPIKESEPNVDDATETAKPKVTRTVKVDAESDEATEAEVVKPKAGSKAKADLQTDATKAKKAKIAAPPVAEVSPDGDNADDDDGESTEQAVTKLTPTTKPPVTKGKPTPVATTNAATAATAAAAAKKKPTPAPATRKAPAKRAPSTVSKGKMGKVAKAKAVQQEEQEEEDDAEKDGQPAATEDD